MFLGWPSSSLNCQSGIQLSHTIPSVYVVCCLLQIGTPTVYAGLTLGGVLATSAHGSGFEAPSGIWDTLLEISWVDGTGKVCVDRRGLLYLSAGACTCMRAWKCVYSVLSRTPLCHVLGLTKSLLQQQHNTRLPAFTLSIITHVVRAAITGARLQAHRPRVSRHERRPRGVWRDDRIPDADDTAQLHHADNLRAARHQHAGGRAKDAQDVAAHSSVLEARHRAIQGLPGERRQIDTCVRMCLNSCTCVMRIGKRLCVQLACRMCRTASWLSQATPAATRRG